MPTLTGTQFLRVIPNPPMVIFTTAYEQYALEGFELNVMSICSNLFHLSDSRKLLKERANQLFTLRQKEEGQTTPTERGFFIFSEYKEIKIYYDEIRFVEGLKDYVENLHRHSSPSRF